MSAEPIIIEREVQGDVDLKLIQAKVEALNKKLSKKGIVGVALTSHQSGTIYIVRSSKHPVKEAPKDPLDLLSIIPVYSVRLEVLSLKHDGWSLLGVLSPLNGANLLNEVPGRKIPLDFRDRVNECDHCGCVRNRKKTMVVAHDDGRVLCVGGSCLKDFLGHSVWTVLDVESISESLASDDFWAGGGGGYHDLSLENYLAWVAAVIEEDGWKSRSSCFDGGISTSDTAVSVMMNEKPFNAKAAEWEDFREKRTPTDKHLEMAKEALAWARGLEPSGDNSYQANLSLLVKGDRISRKHVGLAASIISSHQNIKMARIEKAALKDEWVGKVGERLDLDVTVIKVISCPGQYGTVGLHILRDDQNRSLIWFASESTEWMTTGGRYLIKGTVKKHDWYDGRGSEARRTRQTVLTRVKILSEDEEEGEEGGQRIYSPEAASA
jgi:hypothetical protein